MYIKGLKLKKTVSASSACRYRSSLGFCPYCSSYSFSLLGSLLCVSYQPSTEGGDGTPVAVSEDDLPLTLPETDNFKPSGSPESPLAAIESWVNTTDPVSGECCCVFFVVVVVWLLLCAKLALPIDGAEEERVLGAAF